MGNTQNSNTEPQHFNPRTQISSIRSLGNQQQYLQQAYLPSKRLASGVQENHSKSMHDNNNVYNNASINASINETREQVVQFQKIHGNDGKIFVGIDLKSVKNNLEQGNTVVSLAGGEKYMVNYVKFSNEKDYINYTDTLIYRIKMLKSCHKIKMYFNTIVGIYGQKIVSYSTCGTCNIFKVYVVEKHYTQSLDSLLSQDRTSYSNIYSMLQSFVCVMSAFQYKRLRFGAIDFAQIGVSKLNYDKNIHHIHGPHWKNNHNLQWNKQNVKFQQDWPNESKNQYICKVSDPYIRIRPSKNQSIKSTKLAENLVDIYKNQVYQVGQVLQSVLKRKDTINQQNRKAGNLGLNFSQQKIRAFLQNLVKQYMICDISDRYNWLQIQRYFQQFHNKQSSTQPVSLMQSVNTNYELQQKGLIQTNFVSSSLEKLPRGDSSPRYNIPNLYKGPSVLKQTKLNGSFNKENLGKQSSPFIALKPLKRSQSKPNILIHGPAAPSEVKVPNSSTLASSNVPDIKISHLHQPSPVSYQQTPTFPLPISSSILTVPTPSSLLSPPSLQPSLPTNSGYGVVQNTQPQHPINGKIKYDNLYNIGKYWTKFQGNFVNGSKQGPGTIYLTNGNIFTGVFLKDLANGKGAVYVDGELVIKGTWKDNLLVVQF